MYSQFYHHVMMSYLRAFIRAKFNCRFPVRRSAVTTLLTLTFICSTGKLFAQEGGYSTPASVAQGDSIRFYISTSSNAFTLAFYRTGISTRSILNVPGVKGSLQPVPDSSYRYGCRWTVSYTMQIPTTWTSGLYTAQFPVTGGTRTIPFVVRQKLPGSTSGLVLNVALNTVQAYNNYGGKSLYGFNSTDSSQSYKVSFDRPYANSGSLQYTNALIKWLEVQKIACEYITNTDLDADSSLLSHYSLLTLGGHDEYWTGTERTSVERFIAAGGRFICLGGNTCWWQARVEDNGHTLVCYRSASLDPLTGVDNTHVTVNWYNSPVYKPENLFMGASYRNGGYVNSHGYLLSTDGYGGYTAYNTQHWIYQGTGVRDGDMYGYPSSLAGYEVDGALFAWRNGVPVPTGTDQTPPGYRILGISPASAGDTRPRHATMGMSFFAGGGAVFNAASINWPLALATDSTVQKITANIFRRFASNSYPPEILSWSPSRVVGDSINHEWVFVNKRDTVLAAGETVRFSVGARDLRGETLQYLWTVNGATAGTDSALAFTTTTSPLQDIITAYCFTSHDTSSLTWVVNILNAPPSLAPVLLLPTANAAGQPVRPLFSWTTVKGAAVYHIQISTDSSWQSTSISDMLLSDTVYTAPTLSYLTRYYWRVGSANGFGAGPWSSSFSFVTQAVPPGAPSLISPADSAVNQPIALSLLWHAVPSARQFKLQLGTDSTFVSPPVIDTTLSDTVKNTAGLAYSKTYYWRVLGINAGAVGPWSVSRRFTTSPPPPSAPLLVSPANGSTNLSNPIRFQWGVSSGAVSYRFQAATDSLFRTGIRLDTIVTQTLLQTGSFQRGTKYYWRVAGKAGTVTGAWSSTWKFTMKGALKKEEVTAGPELMTLLQNYPNPFNPSTQIAFTLGKPASITLKVYNLIGQEAATILDRTGMGEGYHEVEFYPGNLPSGVYLYTVTAEYGVAADELTRGEMAILKTGRMVYIR